jgi:hypothetical protein
VVCIRSKTFPTAHDASAAPLSTACSHLHIFEIIFLRAVLLFERFHLISPMAASENLKSESIVHSSGNTSGPPDLRFIHYNDVYHVDSSSAEPVGGFPRFKTLCNYYRNNEAFKGQPELLTFFSGDAFNPSLESSVTKGR